jgi:hypothetical protein
MTPKKRVPDMNVADHLRAKISTMHENDPDRDWMEMLLDEDRPDTKITIHLETGEICKAHPEMSNYYVGAITGKVYQRNAKSGKLRKEPVSLWSHKIRAKATLTEKRCLYTSPILMSLTEAETKRNKTVNYVEFVAETYLNKPAEETHWSRVHLLWQLVISRTDRVSSITSHFPYCPPEILLYSTRKVAPRDKVATFYNAVALQDWKSKSEKIEMDKLEDDDDEQQTFVTLGNGTILPTRPL